MYEASPTMGDFERHFFQINMAGWVQVRATEPKSKVGGHRELVLSFHPYKGNKSTWTEKSGNASSGTTDI